MLYTRIGAGRSANACSHGLLLTIQLHVDILIPSPRENKEPPERICMSRNLLRGVCICLLAAFLRNKLGICGGRILNHIRRELLGDRDFLR